MVVFTVVFGQLGQVFRAPATCPTRCWCWPACCRGTCSPPPCSEASGSLVGNASLISKVYFPRLIVPVAAVVVALCRLLRQPR